MINVFFKEKTTLLLQVSGDALHKRHEQGWVLEVTSDLDTCVSMIRAAKNERRATSIGYHGNIVDLWLEIS